MALTETLTLLTSIGSPFLFLAILLGWTYCFGKLLSAAGRVTHVGLKAHSHQTLTIPLGLSLFNATSFLSLSIFFVLLLGGNPAILAYTLLGSGLVLLYFGRILFRSSPRFLLYFLSLSILCLIAAFGLKFRSIDDYSFWGPISKYLYLFKSLPNNDNYIHANFLSYTPGMASFHYFLFSLCGRYSQFLGYFAQGLVFVSALLVFGDVSNWVNNIELKPKLKALVNMSLVFILFFLAYGFVLGRMEVDAYVAVYFLTSCWIIYKGTTREKEGNESRGTLIWVALPLLFLSVIKEIGLLFAIFSLIFYLVLAKPKGVKNWLSSLFILLSLFTIKMLWKYHVQTAGFKSFSNGISITNAIQALNPFNEQYHLAQLLFLKEALLANFDHVLKIPYIVIYVLMAGIYYFILQKFPENKNSAQLFMRVFSLFAVIYLVMLYLLQTIVFQAGHHTNPILDFSRYYNMLFLPWFSMLILITLDKLDPKWLYQSRNSAIVCVFISSIFFITGKVERSFKFYDNPQFGEIISQIEGILLTYKSAKASEHLKICLQNPLKLSYQVGMPLSYFLMPDRVYYPVRKEDGVFCDLIVRWTNDKSSATVTTRKF